MRYSLVHELPGRLRIELSVPRSQALDPSFVESSLSVLPGVEHVSFSPRSGRLTVRHNSASGVRDALLNTIKETLLPLSREKRRELQGVERQKRAVMVSGVFLAARSLVPATLRPLLALCGSISILKKGASAAVHRRLNAEVLDATAVGVAMGVGDHGTAGTISFLLKLGGYLEEWTKQKSSRRLAEMFCGREGWAWVKRDGRETRIDANDIAAGDLVVVRAGGRIPVDGVVVEGEAMVNQSSITGEPFPVAKRAGITVYAGTALSEGRLVVRAVRVGSETKVSKIVKIIRESESLKADAQSHAERLADRIVPYSFLLSGLTYALTGNALRAATALLVDSSCAIKLSVPLAIRTAMMDASRRGVLIKGGRFIEKMARADAVPFLRSLREAGVHRIIMLTGDGETAARKAADELGIRE